MGSGGDGGEGRGGVGDYVTDSQDLWRDHRLDHPTISASFLAMNGGSSISEVEAAGIGSLRGRKPLLSIRLGGMGPHNVTQQLVMMLL